MKKVNTNSMEEIERKSPRGKYVGYRKHVSQALGRIPESSDLDHRHPFDVEIMRLPPGATNYPFHAHSAQWELYHVIAGSGLVRDAGGSTPVSAGDAFLFKPGEAHQIINDGADDLILYVIADNPFGEMAYYPDSGKWIVYLPERRLIRSEALDYYDGEE